MVSTVNNQGLLNFLHEILNTVIPLVKKTIKRNILNKRKIISTKVYHTLNRKAIYMATLTRSVDTDEILHLLMDDKCSF